MKQRIPTQNPVRYRGCNNSTTHGLMYGMLYLLEMPIFLLKYLNKYLFLLFIN